jgi:hypothetical protein
MFGRDLSEERDLRMQETIDEFKFQNDLQQKMQELQTSLSSQAQSMAQQPSPGYNQQQIIASADGLVQQFMSMDPNTRRSQLDSLQAEDYVMYSVVIQRLEEMQTQQEAAARQQMTMQGAPPPNAQPAGGVA